MEGGLVINKWGNKITLQLFPLYVKHKKNKWLTNINAQVTWNQIDEWNTEPAFTNEMQKYLLRTDF